MAHCPCCSNTLLRHIRHNQLTYFCRHCWQDMPLFEDQPERELVTAARQSAHLSASLPGVLVHRTRYAATLDSSRLTTASLSSVQAARSARERERAATVGVSIQN